MKSVAVAKTLRFLSQKTHWKAYTQFLQIPYNKEEQEFPQVSHSLEANFTGQTLHTLERGTKSSKAMQIKRTDMLDVF